MTLPPAARPNILDTRPDTSAPGSAAARVVRQRPQPPAPDIPAGRTPATVAFIRPPALLLELPEPTPVDALLQPAVLAADILPDEGAPDPHHLILLSTDTAQRARTLLNALLADDPDANDPAAALPPLFDAARYAATHPLAPAQRATACRNLSCSRQDLNRFTAAWHAAGQDGLHTLVNRFEADPALMTAVRERVRAHLRTTCSAPRVSCDDNRITGIDPAFHLRYGRDGLWHPYTSDARTPAGAPEADPLQALARSLSS